MSDTIEQQQQAMWDAYSAREYEKALAVAIALGPKHDNGLRALLEEHVARVRARAAALHDVQTLPATDARHLVSRARLILLEIEANASSDPRLGEALAYLEQVLEREPENADALALRWSVHAQRGEKSESRATARRLASLRPTAKNLLRLARETPDRFEQFTLLLAASKVGGAPGEVAEALNTILVDPPDMMSDIAVEEITELAEIHEHAALFWGRRLRDWGRPEAAIAVWRAFPSDRMIRMDLEDLLRELGRDAEADALLDDE